MFKAIRVGTGTSALTVIGVRAKTTSPPQGLARLSKGTREAVSRAMKWRGFRAEPGQTCPAGDACLLLGLGPREDLEPARVRTIGAQLARALDPLAPRTVQLLLDDACHDELPPEDAGRCLAEGIGLGNWRVDFFDGAATRTEPARPGLSLRTDNAAMRRGLRQGLTLADCTNYARRLAATPPNLCRPADVTREARAMARAVGLKCQVIGERQARQMGMGGLVNVGQASSAPPCLIILKHQPARVARAARGVRLALVGKTITYDTGGYSLKISNSMKGMKYDKNGGMAVLGAMRAIAMLKLPVQVVGLLPAAENMVAGNGYRPDDIITMYNGISVEVTNTDAEGRLVLADALAYACSKLEPTAVIDAATLTGGVVVALGSWSAGLWCNDDPLRARLESAAGRTGERVWRLPLWPEHRDFMRSKHADIWNSGPKRDGHPLQGAAFLSYFVDEKTPWAHLDIAGVSSVDSDTDLYVQGPTGFGVRLLTEVAASYV